MKKQNKLEKMQSAHEEVPDIVFVEQNKEKNQEQVVENPEETEKKLRELRIEVEEALDQGELSESEVQTQEEMRQENIKRYQEKYTPDWLRKKAGIITKIIEKFWTKEIKTEGKENIPEKGPFAVVCNHFGGGEPEALLKIFKDSDLHFAVAKNIWWNSNPIVRWFLKKLRTIPIEESLANLTEEEKEEALKNQGGNGKAVFRKIIEREKTGKVAMNVEFVRQAVAVLSRGDAVGIFPEGLWLNPEGPMKLRERQGMKQGYHGIELLARQYKKLTGKDLTIVPTAFIEDRETGNKKIKIGEGLVLEGNDTELSDTDWVMSHVAKMLPEKQRGYYKEIFKDIEK